MAVYRYPDGVSFAKTCDNEIGGFMRRQLVICGEKGTIEIRPLEVLVSDGQYTEFMEVTSNEWSAKGELQRTEVYHRYLDMMQNFADMLGGKENPYTYDYELGLYELILKSCRTSGV